LLISRPFVGTYMTPFGHSVRSIRSRQGITLTELANELGITVSYLSAIELGKRRKVPEELLKKISDSLGVSIQEREQLGILARKSSSAVDIPLDSEPCVYLAAPRLMDKLANGSDTIKVQIWSFLQGLDAESEPVLISSIPTPTTKRRKNHDVA